MRTAVVGVIFCSGERLDFMWDVAVRLTEEHCQHDVRVVYVFKLERKEKEKKNQETGSEHVQSKTIKQAAVLVVN